MKRPKFKKKIKIEGPCLFLVGPIGTFFARLLKYLDKENVQTYKILFPLHEYGFSKLKVIRYSRDMIYFKEFLRKIIFDKNIKHIFMYGIVLLPHRYALDLVEELNREGIKIHTHIFELGYLRPNFVTLEDQGVNYKSSLILDKKFFDKQKIYNIFPEARSKGLRIRKIWKSITFINHSFKKYKIVEFDHKLQPKPIFIWYQIKGFLLKYFYSFAEYSLKKKFLSINNFFIVILQVSSDSQLTHGSNIKDNNKFIYEVINSFAKAKLKNINLVFKHHPRDRGYTNYSKTIMKLSRKFDIKDNVFYFHDYSLAKIFQNSNCKGTVLINSTVGYQSLYHSIPLKALGISPFNIEGLSDQRNLVSFFENPLPVDRLFFNKFYKFVLENSQINGDFDGFFPFNKVFVFR